MSKAHNIYIVRNGWRDRYLEQYAQIKLFVQDFLCVLSIFATLYFGLVIGCAIESCGGY